MRIYVAARWGRRAEALRLAEILIEAGHEITSTWLRPGVAEGRSKRDNALMDLAELGAAECLVLLAEPVGASNVGGNRYFECGAAVAMALRVIVVGDRELVFFHLPQVEVVASILDLMHMLD